eukprot:2668190-Amphidinium_carterae.1
MAWMVVFLPCTFPSVAAPPTGTSPPRDLRPVVMCTGKWPSRANGSKTIKGTTESDECHNMRGLNLN